MFFAHLTLNLWFRSLKENLSFQFKLKKKNTNKNQKQIFFVSELIKWKLGQYPDCLFPIFHSAVVKVHISCGLWRLLLGIERILSGQKGHTYLWLKGQDPPNLLHQYQLNRIHASAAWLLVMISAMLLAIQPSPQGAWRPSRKFIHLWKSFCICKTRRPFLFW